MKINTKPLIKLGTPWIILIVCIIAFILSLLISVLPISAELISIFLIVLVLTPFFINNLELLFYVFIASFALGDVGVQINTNLPKLSFSNLWMIYSMLIILLHFIMRRRGQVGFKLERRKLILLSSSVFLVLMVFYSSVVYGSYRSLITQIGYLLVIILVISTVENDNILMNGINLGFLSIVALSLLTILTSLGIISFGYRVDWDSGLAPWESFLPRAIGLPQMQGGLHNVFILSVLPVSLIMYLRKRGRKIHRDLFYLTGIAFCIVAVFISLFRSGWLGLLTAFSTLVYLKWRYASPARNKIIFILLMLIILLGCVFFVVLEFETISNYIYQFFFEVRGSGVDKRLAQYRFALRTIPSSVKSIIFGYGEKAIREDFPSSPEAYGLRNALDIGLHNHFLGYMYAYGIIYTLVYLFIIFKTFQWLINDIQYVRSKTRLISIGLLAGLLGSVVVLFFSSSLAGFKILWAVFSVAAILPELYE